MASLHTAYLSLGSNLGDREARLAKALELLDKSGVRLARRSSLYLTEAVEVLPQPDFLNLACQVVTNLDVFALLSACQSIERLLGRLKRGAKGPREIDIDILYFNDLVIRHPGLQIPHPGIPRRQFVLRPMLEIAPDHVDPQSGQSIRRLFELCPDHSRVVEWPGGG